MAEVPKSGVKRPDIQSLDSVHYLNGNFGNCALMNHKYQEAFVELKSLQLTNIMLHKEIKTLRSQLDDTRTSIKESTITQYSDRVSEQEICNSKQEQLNLSGRSAFNKEYMETQWSVIGARRRKGRSHTRHIATRPIPVIHNRYEVLTKCAPSEHTNSVSMRSYSMMSNNGFQTNKPTKKKRKILIIGDSHAWGIAAEIQHNLDEDF